MHCKVSTIGKESGNLPPPVQGTAIRSRKRGLRSQPVSSSSRLARLVHVVTAGSQRAVREDELQDTSAIQVSTCVTVVLRFKVSHTAKLRVALRINAKYVVIGRCGRVCAFTVIIWQSPFLLLTLSPLTQPCSLPGLHVMV